VITVTLPYTYSVPVIGRFNVTFIANDTSGNNVTAQDYFMAGSTSTVVQFNVINTNLSGISVNFTLYLSGTNQTVQIEEINGTLVNNHTNILYDLYYVTPDENLSVKLNSVNLSINNNDTIGLDKNMVVTGFLVSYGVNTSYSFSNALVVVSYAGTGYTDEDNLKVYKCSSWDFTGRTCLSNWIEVTGVVQDKASHTFTFTTTSFSAFSVKQEVAAVSGGGGGESYRPVIPRLTIDQENTIECGGETGVYKVKVDDNSVEGALFRVELYGDIGLVTSYNTTTDAHGMVQVYFGQPGRYEIMASKSNYATGIKEVMIKECAPPIVPNVFVENYTLWEIAAGNIRMPGGVCNTSVPTSMVRNSATIIRAFYYEKGNYTTNTVLSTKLLFNGTQDLVVYDTVPSSFAEDPSGFTLSVSPGAYVTHDGANFSFYFERAKGEVEFNYTLWKESVPQYMGSLISTMPHPMLFVFCAQPTEALPIPVPGPGPEPEPGPTPIIPVEVGYDSFVLTLVAIGAAVILFFLVQKVTLALMAWQGKGRHKKSKK
jgi:hypothetical protein